MNVPTTSPADGDGYDQPVDFEGIGLNPDATFPWAEATATAECTYATIVRAIDEIKYGPLPTVEDILNEGLEPKTGIWEDHPYAPQHRFIDPGPMALLDSRDLLPDRDDARDAFMYAWRALPVAPRPTRITDIGSC